MKVTKTYFMLMVKEMARAETFYRRVFGLEPVFSSPEWTELKWQSSTVALHGGGSAESKDTGLGFEVDDLEGACAAVKEAGGQVLMPPTDRPGEPIRLAFVADTEGNGFSIVQPKK